MAKKGEIRLLMLIVSCLCIMSCQEKMDDINSEAEIRGTIVGEWLEDQSSGDTKLYVASKWNEDGTSEGLLVFVNKTESVYDFHEGYYTYNNRVLTDNQYSDGLSITNVYNLMYLDGYSMTTYHAESATMGTSHRIIDTYDMNVGDSHLFVVGDMDFIPTEYSSLDKSIATVDEDGMIHAIRRGSTFIKAMSSLGIAVIRVNVTDPENVIDDFSKFMGASIDDVKKVYGSNYEDFNNGTLVERHYNIADELIQSAVFMYFARKVFYVNITLRETVDFEAILSSFRQKYEPYKNINNTFVTNVDGKNVIILVYPYDYNITYVYEKESTPEPDIDPADASYLQFADIINMNAFEAAEFLEHEITDDEWEDGSFDIDIEDNDIFQSLSVMFDGEEEPYEVETVILRCKKGISQEDIEPWYKEHYQETGDNLNPYCSEGETFYIRFKVSGSRTLVYYSKRKARK